MRGYDVVFDGVNVLHYQCHKQNLRRGGSFTDSPNWIQIKKTTKVPINDNDKCIKSAATVALNHEEIRKNIQGTSKVKPLKSKTGKKLTKIIQQ